MKHRIPYRYNGFIFWIRKFSCFTWEKTAKDDARETLSTEWGTRMSNECKNRELVKHTHPNDWLTDALNNLLTAWEWDERCNCYLCGGESEENKCSPSTDNMMAGNHFVRLSGLKIYGHFFAFRSPSLSSLLSHVSFFKATDFSEWWSRHTDLSNLSKNTHL